MDSLVEIDRWWLFVLGTALLLATLMDVAWTAIAAGVGRGPLTRLVTGAVSRLLTAGRVGRRRRQVAGYVVVVSLLCSWAALLVAGFSLLYLSGEAPIVDANKPGGVSPVAVVGYAAGGLAGAGAGFTASTGFWELVNNVSALVGLAFFTLGVTFLLRVVNADARGRSAASDVSALGATPLQAVERALAEPDLSTLQLQVVSLSSSISQVAQDHLSVPLLQYLSPVQRQAAIARAVVLFDEILTLVECGMQQQRPLLVASGRSAVDDFMGTLALPRSLDEPPHLSLEPLSRSAGLPPTWSPPTRSLSGCRCWRSAVGVSARCSPRTAGRGTTSTNPLSAPDGAGPAAAEASGRSATAGRTTRRAPAETRSRGLG